MSKTDRGCSSVQSGLAQAKPLRFCVWKSDKWGSLLDTASFRRRTGWFRVLITRKGTVCNKRSGIWLVITFSVKTSCKYRKRGVSGHITALARAWSDFSTGFPDCTGLVLGCVGPPRAAQWDGPGSHFGGWRRWAEKMDLSCFTVSSFAEGSCLSSTL